MNMWMHKKKDDETHWKKKDLRVICSSFFEQTDDLLVGQSDFDDRHKTKPEMPTLDILHNSDERGFHE